MAEPLKYLYNPFFFESIIPVLRDQLPPFDERKFIFSVFDEKWPDLELKQRVRYIAVALRKFFPEHYPEAVIELIDLVKAFRRKEFREQGFELIFLADFIEVFGQDYFAESMAAIEEVTKLVSAEFAIRPFLMKYPEKSLLYMLSWANNENQNVRRLASEGLRSRLPWAMGVPWLKAKPEKILPVLESLKRDPSEYVRRSVANNLNDMAKDHPSLVLKIVKSWKGEHPLTDQVIRHGSRTLLKKGDPKILQLHGINPKSSVQICSFSLHTGRVKIGEALGFTIEIKNKETTPTKFKLDYAIDYLTATGRKSMKVFKLREDVFPVDEMIQISKRQSFENFTTRKHFKGRHCIHILVNGQKAISQEFDVC
jgi:3-methyladenine DNA glycosylase AlkC